MVEGKTEGDEKTGEGGRTKGVCGASGVGTEQEKDWGSSLSL